MPCPYALRWMLEIPRPYLTRADVLDALAPRPGEAVLEVGPGNGYHSLPVARELEPGGPLHAFDVQPKMLDALMSRPGSEGDGSIAARHGGETELPYHDGSFDAAFL